LAKDRTSPEASAAAFGNVTPENAERIVQEHLIGGRIATDLPFAKNPLYLRDAEIS
jgi:(2Fe-2S) ferredoxin